MSVATIDPERQQQAKTYARINQRLMLLELLIGTVYTLCWLVLGWSQSVADSLMQYTDNEWLLVAGFAALFGGIYFALTLPISFYSGYTLPHRFGLSNQNLSGWLSDLGKGLLLSALLGGLLIEITYAVLRISPDWWWLWLAAFLLLFTIIMANLAPVLLMPIFYKFVPLGDDHAELVKRLLRLAEKAHTRVRGVYKFDISRRTKAANAALTGLGNTRRIILGDTLIDEFTTDEIETMLTHELGHHVHRDIPVGIAVESAMTLIGLYLASLGMRWGVAYFGFDGPADVAAMPLLVAVMGAYGLVTMPLSNAFSRWRERRADAYAVQATGNGAAYASALSRLANQNLADAEPEAWVEFVLYSHPALSKRIAMAHAISTPLPVQDSTA